MAEAQNSEVSPPRIEALDSIRGLAALVVLLGHCMGIAEWPFSLSWTALPLVNTFFDARSAVTMFFVLSGFVLSLPYFNSAGESRVPAPVTLFYLRRGIRIWIPWLGAFLLSLACQKWLFRPYTTFPPKSEWLGWFWHNPPTLPLFLKQCVFLEHAISKQLLPQDWSLGVELKGSALIPVFLLLSRRGTAWLLTASSFLLIFLPTGEYYLSFALGLLAARFYQKEPNDLRGLAFSKKIGCLVLGVLLYEARLACTYSGSTSVILEKAVWSLASVGCVLTILVSTQSRRIGNFLAWRPIIFLGRISYSLYLIQFIVLLCLSPALILACNHLGIQHPAMVFILTFGLSVVFAIGLARIFYEIVESPAIRLGRIVSNRLKAKRSQP